ncbi:MAG: substrate-binding domain-containing protein [Prevotellaceae bacterium]|jgi:phosphate transport system substrate-binding protein|nr:substrate-binding domain-containing protein [Prevotellaceae bacterium]
MRNIILTLLSVIFLAFYTVSCNNNRVTRTDTETSGSAKMGADESFAPIVEEELAVFTGLNPEASITVEYLDEPDLLKALLDDSLQLVMAVRDLTDSEKRFIKQRKQTPRSQRIAVDGIALIINRENKDSLISTADLTKIMTGEIAKWNEITNAEKSKLGDIQVVFDNPRSSMLRYINDSIARGAQLSDKLSALKNDREVLDYVARTPNALGVIGVNWVSNPGDSLKLTFSNTIRVMWVSRSEEPTLDNSYQPIPAYLRTGDYALTRDLYLIITDVRGGLPSGFVKFFAGDAGQRIVYRAGLVPATAPTRLISIQEM